MTERENYIRAARFETPQYIPMTFVINAACWQHYEHQAIFDLMEAHPFLFPAFERPTEAFIPQFSPIQNSAEPYTDDFGCVWTTAIDGLTGTVTGHPLADWADFPRWQAPDPALCMGIGPIDWEQIANSYRMREARGQLRMGGLRHGHTFLQLSDLRGYENLLYDFADDEPLIWELIAAVEGFNLGIVERYLTIGVDVMSYAEDLGMQQGPMLSPEQFRRFIKPSYQRLMQPARAQGVLVHMHSDGDIRALIDDIIEGGVDIINLQDLVNGVDWIARRFAGRTCVDLDIDRQRVTVFGTPAEVEQLVAEPVKRIGSKKGGLMMVYGWYPGTPLANVSALMDAMEQYAHYYA